jgi:hypothetical protein
MEVGQTTVFAKAASMRRFEVVSGFIGQSILYHIPDMIFLLLNCPQRANILYRNGP